jgi:phosphate-selective porin OprO/OprP
MQRHHVHGRSAWPSSSAIARAAVAVCAIVVMGGSHAVAAAMSDARLVAGTRVDRQTPDPADTSSSAKTKTKKKHKKTPQPSDGDEGSAKRTKHPSVTIGKSVTIDFTGRIEGSVRSATPAVGLDGASGDWQDRRIGIQGRAFKRFEFEVSRELGEDFDTSIDSSEKTAWRDVYVDTRVTKALRLEAGQFKLPFGREELTSEANLDFAYRSLATRVLAPGRDPGLMAHGRLLAKALEYQVGYFTRDGSNSRTAQTEGGQDAFVARLVATPFASSSIRAIAPLEIGAAFADSRLDDRLGIRGRTVLGDSVFFDRVDVNGRRLRVGWEAAWADGPVGVSTEYIRSSDERRGMGFSSTDLPNVDASGWYVAGTWAVTGERKHGRLEPHHDFLRGGAGAVELAARVESLGFDATTIPTTEFGFPDLSKFAGNADRAATLGVNWYLNRYAKIQANVIHESIDDPARSPAPTAGGRFTSTVIAMQFRW